MLYRINPYEKPKASLENNVSEYYARDNHHSARHVEPWKNASSWFRIVMSVVLNLHFVL